MDDSIDSGESTEAGPEDLCVSLPTLEIDGVRPAVGDTVNLKVDGSVSKIVNDCAWVTPSTINGQPIPEGMPDANDDQLMQSAMAHDQMSASSMGGY